MQTIKLTIEYDGTGYVGWQIQPNGRSIQEDLEKAINQILQEKVSTVAAGRTDAGVHAMGQVVSLRVSKMPEMPIFVKSLNALLPPQIAVIGGESVPEDFHARYSARARIYHYHLAIRPTAIERDYSWYVGGFHLDPSVLAECAAMVTGEHDFTSFSKTNSSNDHFRCNVEESNWRPDDLKLVYQIKANRFLYGMVRALVGTMVEIGRGHRPLGDMERLLHSHDRSAAGMAAPAKGLFLQQIIY